VTVKNPKCLAIDVDIARASGGEDAIYPISKRCRDFLKEVRTLGHSMIVTDNIDDEWGTKKHPSAFARQWYDEMRQRGKIRRHRGNTQDDDLREAVLQVIPEDAIETVLKDMRWIEAALLTDKLITSNDNKMRGHMKRAAQNIEKIQDIAWVNPTKPDERCLEWLRQGCPAEKARLLGYRDD
jgi:hypothetical protein